MRESGSPRGCQVTEDAEDDGAGSPDDCIAAIEHLQEITGGIGGLMFRAQEHTTPEKTRQSFEQRAATEAT